MEFVFRMPDLSTVSETVTVVGWLVPIGGSVQRGDPLLEVQTDKATMRVESPVTGVLKSISCLPDEAVAAGHRIAILLTADATETVEPIATVPPSPEPDPAQVIPGTPTPPTSRGTGSFFARNRRQADSSGSSPIEDLSDGDPSR